MTHEECYPGDFIRIDIKNGIWKLLLFGLYIVSLYVAYYLVLSPTYSYALLTYNPSRQKLLISLLATVFCLFLLPSDTGRPSTFLFYIYFSLTYIPTACYYWLNNQPTAFFLAETLCFLLIAVLIRIPVRSIQIKENRAYVIIQILFVFYVVSCVYLVYHNGGLHLSALRSDLYSVRSENNLSGLVGYLVNWCAKSLMPLFFVYFFIRKKWLGVALTALLQAALFASYGFKAFIVAVLLLIGVSFLMRMPKLFTKIWIFLLTVGNVLATVAAKYISISPINLFSYRTLFLPSQGQFEYYDFFTHHDFLYFSEGSIGRLFGIAYPYSESIGRVVNVYIYGPSKVSNGNTGALSYGFADLGFAGMILAALIIGLILLIVDCSTKNMPQMIPVGAMAYQMFILNDNNILISINTGGIFWSVVFLILLNSIYSGIMDPQAGLDPGILSDSIQHKIGRG